jgi:predicted RNase H-like nuclease (RuvC/YqgF family)
MVTKKKTAHANSPSHQRRIFLYLPTDKMIEKWHKEAEKNKMTTSKFIQEIVKNHIDSGESTINQQKYEKEIKQLQEENRQLRNENIELSKKVKMLDTLTDRYEDEIKLYKNKPFINGDFEGIREFNHRLIELLKEKRNIKEHQLFDLLHISPNDVETIKAINRQLDTLFEYNLVKKYRGGIQWHG